MTDYIILNFRLSRPQKVRTVFRNVYHVMHLPKSQYLMRQTSPIPRVSLCLFEMLPITACKGLTLREWIRVKDAREELRLRIECRRVCYFWGSGARVSSGLSLSICMLLLLCRAHDVESQRRDI